MRTLSRSTFSVLAIMATAVLSAQDQADFPNQVNDPVTKAEPTFWDTPFLWIGIIIFALALILLFLKKGKTETVKRPHKE